MACATSSQPCMSPSGVNSDRQQPVPGERVWYRTAGPGSAEHRRDADPLQLGQAAGGEDRGDQDGHAEQRDQEARRRATGR